MYMVLLEVFSLQSVVNEEEEEEKEVDPSLIGSLDNVYTEAPGTMPGEDPFKRVPMMLDNEKPSNLMEMEKTLEAMEASIDSESSQEFDSSDDMSSLDRSGMRRPRAKQMMPDSPLNRITMSVDLERGEHRGLNQHQQLSDADIEELGAVGGGVMPDLLTGGSTTPPDIQLSSQLAPDVTAHSRNPPPPDLTTSRGPSLGTHRGASGGGREQAVDLLHHTASPQVSSTAPSTDAQPLDLTDGLLGLRVEDGRKGET